MKYRIVGGKKLFGQVANYGAKNSVLALCAASVAASGKTTLYDCKPMSDVVTMQRILEKLGSRCQRIGDVLTIDTISADGFELPTDLSGKLRGSVLLMGALLGRTRKAVVPMPGGCKIGQRPIDIHISAFEKMGVKIDVRDDVAYCDGKDLRPAHVKLRFASVGATENVLLCAVNVRGETVVENCAVEPEVEDLANFLKAMGADVKGIGTRRLVVRGGKKLTPTTYVPIPDRIVAATYLCCCAVCGGEILIKNCLPSHFEQITNILSECGCLVSCGKDFVAIRSSGDLRAFRQVVTAPYPGFATDMQSLALSLAACSKGASRIEENLFENRLESNVRALRAMGANVLLQDNVARVFGTGRLHGANVVANDLRGGAGLVAAALAAEGESVVKGAEHVVRGYFDFDGQLRSVGADVALICQKENG